MAGCQWNDDDAAAPAPDLNRANDGIRLVVAAFHEDVGTNDINELSRCVFLECYHGVNSFERGEHITALSLAANGSRWTFEALHGRVTVDPHDKALPLGARAKENVDVPGMKQVEDAVRKHDWRRGVLPPLGDTSPIHDFRKRVEPVGQSRPSA